MRSSGADNNDVGGLKWAAGSVAIYDGDLRPRRKRDARSFCDAQVNLDGNDLSVRADLFGKNRSVITRAAAQMQHTIVGADVELVDKAGPHAGLAIVDAFGLVERNEHIVIDTPRISVFGHPEFARAKNPPRPRPDKALARHGRKGSEHGMRLEVREVLQLFRVELPCGFDGNIHRGLRRAGRKPIDARIQGERQHAL